MDKSESKTESKSKAFVVAKRVLAWRCLDCELLQFCERSSHHTAECRRCGALCDVHVKKEV